MRLKAVALLALAIALIAAGMSAPAEAVGPNAVRPDPGCNATELPPNDDGSTPAAVPVGFPVNFFGTSYTHLFVNNNGNVTFGSPMGTFTPFALSGAIGRAIIAPFFADVDTRGSGSDVVRYSMGATTVGGRQAFCVNSINVGYFGSHFDKLNSFQLVLVDRSDVGAGDFDLEFNYDQIQWETGDASGGSGGLGGISAGVGFSAGTGEPGTFFEFTGSRVPGSFLDSNAATGLIHGSRNSTQLGRYLFQVRNGAPPLGGTISGTVKDGAGNELANAPVQVCNETTCPFFTQTNATGQYSATGLAAGNYTARAFPPAGSSLSPAQAGPVALATGGTATLDITMTGPTGPPAGTTFGPPTTGIPRLVIGQPATLTTTGCPGGVASYTITGTYGGSTSGTLPEGPAGTYSAAVTLTFTGPAVVRITIDCPSSPDELIEFNIYIDPSGFVLTPGGAPVEGATVTLFRSDTGEAGTFTQVPDGSAIMSPANRTNPDLTDETGHFGWDTITGYYKVRAEKDGCHAPGNPGHAFVETAVLVIPPPVTDIDLRLECAGDSTAPVIAPHADLEVNATSRNGALVSYTAPTATDDVDGTVPVTCLPASGSVFPRGTTNVTCTATDAAGNVATSSFAVVVVDFRTQLVRLRDQLAALALTGQADVRRDSAVAFLDKALLPASWDGDASLVATSPGILALRQIKMAVDYARTPNAQLAAASAGIRVALIELSRTMAEAFYAERAATPGFSTSRLASARSHLDLAAAQPGTPAALEQVIKAWDNLDG